MSRIALVYITVILVLAGLAIPQTASYGDRSTKHIVEAGQLIQNAIDGATSGDTIEICNGTYNESIFVDKPITLKAAEDESVTIRGTVEILADDVTIEGINFRGINSLSDGSVYGILGTYYQDSLKDIPFLETSRHFTQLDKDISFYMGRPGLNPLDGRGLDHYSIRWSGNLVIPSKDNYTFHISLAYHDGVDLFIDGEEIIDKFDSNSDWEEYTGSKPLAAGIHSIQVDFICRGYEGRCMLYWESENGSIERELVPSSTYICKLTEHKFEGIYGSYYAGDTPFKGENFTRLDKVIDFYHADLVDPLGGNYDHYSIRWLGNVMAPETGTYTFYISLAYQDGVDLFIDGEEIIDKFDSNSDWEEYTGSKPLDAGIHSIQVDFICKGYQGMCKLEWSSNGDGEAQMFERCLIPETAFSWDLRTPFLDSGGVVTRLKPDGTHIKGLDVKFCNFQDCLQGVQLFNAWSSTVESCEFNNAHQGVVINSLNLSHTTEMYSKGNEVIDCTFNKHDGDDGDAVAIIDSSSNVVKKSYIDARRCAIRIQGGAGNLMDDNNNITNCDNGIALFNTSNNEISSSDINGCSYGVRIEGGEGNIVTSTTRIIGSDFHAIYFNQTTNFRIDNNVIRDNGGDIYISGCRDFNISNNKVTGSTIVLDCSTNGYFEENDFFKTGAQSFTIVGEHKDYYDHTIKKTNYIWDGTEYSIIEYHFDESGSEILHEEVGTVMIAYCSGVSVEDVAVRGGDGIWIHGSSDCTVDATIEDCIYGVDIDRSERTVIQTAEIATTDRSTHAVRAIGCDVSCWDSVIDTSRTINAPAFRLERDAVVSLYNTTFDGRVDAANDGGGTLKVYNPLTIQVWKKGGSEPLSDVEIEVTRDNNAVYSTPHFGGTDAVTDSNGLAGPIQLLDHEYVRSDTPTNHAHAVEVWIERAAVWTDKHWGVDTTKPHLEVFEAEEIDGPPIPANFQVVDIPDEDAIDVTWDAVAEATTYSVYWNAGSATGEWVLLANVSAPTTTYRVADGLVDQRTYYFKLTAWSDVPLESTETNALSVLHVVSNHAPTLSGGAMDPATGDTGTKFGFTVTYNDADGDNGTVWVVIDGERHEMTGDPSDTDATDGRLFTYRTKLGKGNHTYHFEAEDEPGKAAGGPSAGPSNQQTTADVKKEAGKSPGAGGAAAVVAAAVMALTFGAVRRGRKP